MLGLLIRIQERRIIHLQYNRQDGCKNTGLDECAIACCQKGFARKSTVTAINDSNGAKIKTMDRKGSICYSSIILSSMQPRRLVWITTFRDLQCSTFNLGIHSDVLNIQNSIAFPQGSVTNKNPDSYTEIFVIYISIWLFEIHTT